MSVGEVSKTAIGSGRAAARDAGDAQLLRAAMFFALAVVLHNADHVRRGADAVGRDVFWVGTAGIFLEVGVVALICARHRLAPAFAAVAGVVLTLGYGVVHFLPTRSWLSDSFTSGSHVSRLSWSAASLEVAAAITLAVVGLVVLTGRGGIDAVSRPHPGERSLRDGLLHPLALAFAISQLVVIVVSFAQL